MVEKLVEFSGPGKANASPRDVHGRSVDHKDVRGKLVIGVEISAKVSGLSSVHDDLIEKFWSVSQVVLDHVLVDAEEHHVYVLLVQSQLHKEFQRSKETR